MNMPTARMRSARNVSLAADAPDLSIVIGYRDWGAERLNLALRAHVEALGDFSYEIIVSDYGSEERDTAARLAERHGARVVYTEVEGHWNRSRCLNIGVAAARADCVMTTDTDMLFRPTTHQVILDAIHGEPRAVHLLQCKNLTPEHNESSIEAFDWDEFESTSFFRPRWGMGGLAGFSRRLLFEKLGGYDERMEVYGAEDTDLGERLQRGGFFMNWIDDPAARIYHIWHEPTLNLIQRDEAQTAALQRNRELYKTDKSVLRNAAARKRGAWSAPLCSVIVTTYNRPQFLAASIRSVLAQTAEDFELLVIDDGSPTDEAEAICAGFADPRLRFFKRLHLGVGAARNFALEEARADWIVIHDDDDLMLPNRIESHFAALEAGMSGTYGGWIDFDDETGALTFNNGKRPFSYENVAFGSRVLVHGATMLHRDTLAQCRYSETLPFTIDYNAILQIGRAGYRLGHTGKYAILRRVHAQSVTTAFSPDQRYLTTRPIAILFQDHPPDRRDALRKAARELPDAPCANARSPAYFNRFLMDEGAYVEMLGVSRWVRWRARGEALAAALVASGEIVRFASFDLIFSQRGAQMRGRIAAGGEPPEALARMLVEKADGVEALEGLEFEQKEDAYGAPITVFGPVEIQGRAMRREEHEALEEATRSGRPLRPEVAIDGAVAQLDLALYDHKALAELLKGAVARFPLLRLSVINRDAPRRTNLRFSLGEAAEAGAFIELARTHFPKLRTKG